MTWKGMSLRECGARSFGPAHGHPLLCSPGTAHLLVTGPPLPFSCPWNFVYVAFTDVVVQLQWPALSLTWAMVVQKELRS